MSTEDIFYRDDSPMKVVQSPLCCACYSGYLPLVKYLIEECGCDPVRLKSGKDTIIGSSYG